MSGLFEKLYCKFGFHQWKLRVEVSELPTDGGVQPFISFNDAKVDCARCGAKLHEPRQFLEVWNAYKAQNLSSSVVIDE